MSKITSNGNFKDIMLEKARKLLRKIRDLEKEIEKKGFDKIEENKKYEYEKYEKWEKELDNLKKRLEKLKDLEIYNEIDAQLWIDCEEEIKNSNREKEKLRANLNEDKIKLEKTNKKLNDIEIDLKKLDKVGSKLKNCKEKNLELALHKGKRKFFITLLIISTISFGIFAVRIIFNPSLLFYILALLFSISMVASGMFELQFIRNKSQIKKEFNKIKLIFPEFGLNVENIEEAIQRFYELYRKKSEELQEIRREKENLESEIKKKREKILEVEKRIEDANRKIYEIKRRSKSESLEEYKKKLKWKDSLKKFIKNQEDILTKLFGRKSEELSENISYWEEIIEILEILRKIKDVKQKAEEILQSKLPEDLKVIEDLIKHFIQKIPNPRIEPPYVQIDLDETKVFLIIPKQQLKTKANDISQPLYYKLQLNEEEKTIQAKVTKEKNGNAIIIEEIKIELDSPIKNFKITYPAELEGRSYEYHHANDIFYIFIAIGNNRGRMYYLYSGNVNTLPKKNVWILVKEGFDLAIQPDSIEETWIWEKYRPVRINLKNTNELVIKNNQTGEENKIPCEISFSIQCDKLVEDDFKEQNPIFVGNSVKIIAPVKDEEGWMVLIRNKQAGYKIINENWKGDNPLELKLPDDLPCECGEFQIDICKKEDEIPVETLFFRYIPNLQLEYPQEIIIPNLNTGHNQEIIKIILENDPSNWELKIVKNLRYKQMENGYEIELPPSQDTLRFSLVKKDKPETETNFQITVSRLRWKTSNMIHMTDKPFQIKKDELIPGSDLYLFVSINYFKTDYDFKAILEMDEQKLQEEKLTRKNMIYTLLLNRFYDTVKKNKGNLKLILYIHKLNEMKPTILRVECIHFSKIVIVKKIWTFRLVNPKYEIAKKLERVIDWRTKNEIKKVEEWIEENRVKLEKYKVFSEKIASCTLVVETEIGPISMDVFLKRYPYLFLEAKYIKKVITDEPPRLNTELKKIKTFRLLNPMSKVAKSLAAVIDWRTKNEIKKVEEWIEVGIELMKYKVLSKKVASCTLEIETLIGKISIDVFLKRLKRYNYVFYVLQPKYVKVEKYRK